MPAVALRPIPVCHALFLSALVSIGCSGVNAETSDRDLQALAGSDPNATPIGTDGAMASTSSSSLPTSVSAVGPAASEPALGAMPESSATNPTPSTATNDATLDVQDVVAGAPRSTLTDPTQAATSETVASGLLPSTDSTLPATFGTDSAPTDTAAPACVLHHSYGDSPDFCQAYGFCDQGVIGTYCGKGADGTWDCSCNGYNRVNSFKAKLGDSSLCRESIALCADSVSPARDRSGYSCGADTAVSDAESCTLTRPCTREEAFSPQFTATLDDPRQAHCTKQADGTLACDCGVSGTARQYELTGAANIESGCETALALCEAGATEHFPAGEGCTLTTTETPLGCHNEATCVARSALEGGVTGVLTIGTPLDCQKDSATGRWSCNCGVYPSNYEQQRNLYFSSDDPSSGTDMCSTHRNVCRLANEDSLHGQLACHVNPDSVTADPDYCDAVVNCTQDAVVDEHAVVFESYLNTACERVSGDAWSCACSSADGGAAGLSVTASDSAAACAASATLCPGQRPQASLDR